MATSRRLTDFVRQNDPSRLLNEAKLEQLAAQDRRFHLVAAANGLPLNFGGKPHALVAWGSGVTKAHAASIFGANLVPDYFAYHVPNGGVDVQYDVAFEDGFVIYTRQHPALGYTNATVEDIDPLIWMYEAAKLQEEVTVQLPEPVVAFDLPPRGMYNYGENGRPQAVLMFLSEARSLWADMQSQAEAMFAEVEEVNGDSPNTNGVVAIEPVQA